MYPQRKKLSELNSINIDDQVTSEFGNIWSVTEALDYQKKSMLKYEVNIDSGNDLLPDGTKPLPSQC